MSLMILKKSKVKLWLISRLALLFLFIAGFSLQAEQKGEIKNREFLQDEPITVTGVVTDKLGAPLPGVNVYNKANTLQGTITNFDGVYTMELEDANITLVFSFLGFVAQEVEVAGKTKIDVVLMENVTELEDVIVVGYGVQKKENVTGSVATVKMDQMETRPVQSVAGALAGTMSGVTSIQTSGEPGSQKGSVTIRGKNSISGGSPMVIVDGIPGSMSNIDMNDVESISVLKDAASAAIYGVSAANGVILITTKKGKKGSKPMFSYKSFYAWTSPTYLPNYLGSYDYATLYNEAYKNDNPSSGIVPFSDEDLRLYQNGSQPYTHPDVDYFDEVLSNWAFENKQHLQVNGGSEHVTYNASFAYMDQKAIIDDIDYKRYSVRVNLQADITEKFSVGMNLYGHQEYKDENWISSGGVMSYLSRTPPTIPLFNPDGSYSYHSPYNNPLAHIDGDGFRDKNWSEGNVIFNAEYKLLKDLSIKGVYSARFNDTHYKSYRTALTYCNDEGDQCYLPEPNRLEEYYSKSQVYTYQLLINYDLNIKDKHRFHFLAGFEQYENNNDWAKAWRQNYPTDLIYTLNNGDPGQQYNDGTGKMWTRRSVFGRMTYDYLSKYLFEVNMRYDGTSWLPSDTRWGFFPAFSAAWRLSEEGFLKDAENLDNLKLRFGFGSTGNNELGGDYYSYLPTYGIGGAYVFNDHYVQGAWEGRYPNQDITWATVISKEIGLEGTLWRGLLGFEFTMYHKKTKDMILALPVPTILGLSAPKQNKGELKNTGFDLMLNHSYAPGKFSYDINVNFSYVKNEITDMAGADQDDGTYWYGVGYSLGSFYGYKTDGLFKDQNEVDNYPAQPQPQGPGDIKYVDTNGDGVVNSKDRVVIGKNFPSYSLGFNIAGHYKNFDLDLFFQGAFDVDTYFEGEASYAFFNGGKVMDKHLDRWSPDNLDATYPKLTLGHQNNYEKSDYWLENSSYVRLKNITLSYNLPEKTLEKLKIKDIKVYFSGENLLTFTGLDNYDPEAPSVNRGSFYGNVRKLTLGLNIGF